MHPDVLKIAQAVRSAGGRALIVGGWVRDQVLGLASKDCDIEVYGIAPDALAALLARFGKVDAVGVSFGVLKVRLPDGQELDVSLPRRESCIGIGHGDFAVTPDAWMSPQEAARRRDFTMNALAFDPLTDELLDFFGGVADLRAGLLRPTSDAFAEDALRVLRGMQFAARFELTPTPELIAAAQACAWKRHALAVERLWGEWEKLALRGRRPSLGLRLLRETGWLAFDPELAALDGCAQEPAYHPEGDVFVHSGLVADAAAQIADRDGVTGDDRIVLVLAAICHDLGKPVTTVCGPDGRIASPGHAEAGEAPTRAFLARVGAPGRFVARVIPLVREHMAHVGLVTVTPRIVRRLAVRLQGESIGMLCRLIEADHSGRPPLPAGLPFAAQALLAQAQATQVAAGAPAPILMGRHLLTLGAQPGPAMGRALKAAFEAQLDGAFDDLDGALAWAASTR